MRDVSDEEASNREAKGPICAVFPPLTLRVSRWRPCGLHLTRNTWTDRASGQLVVVELCDFVAGSMPTIAARFRGPMPATDAECASLPTFPLCFAFIEAANCYGFSMFRDVGSQ